MSSAFQKYNDFYRGRTDARAQQPQARVCSIDARSRPPRQWWSTVLTLSRDRSRTFSFDRITFCHLYASLLGYAARAPQYVSQRNKMLQVSLSLSRRASALLPRFPRSKMKKTRRSAGRTRLIKRCQLTWEFARCFLHPAFAAKPVSQIPISR